MDKEPIMIDDTRYQYIDICRFGMGTVSQLPYSLRVFLENLLRKGEAYYSAESSLDALLNRSKESKEIPFFPARVLMQDFTGVPSLVDITALRNAASEAGKDPSLIQPHIPVDLIIDHSVQVDYYGSKEAGDKNVEMEYLRNRERYSLLKWAQSSFSGLRVVPPKSGICHQVNLEHLSSGVIDDHTFLYPDSLLGTDSHTTMINGLGVIGWGVGGIEAEAVMLGQPYFMPVPKVIGMRMTGSLRPHCTAADLVLTVTELLRSYGAVGSIVEFFGPGISTLTLPDRATVSNMSPEYGATMGFFPVDEQTIAYLKLTNREAEAERTLHYTRHNGMFYRSDAPEPCYDHILELHLPEVEPCIAGPAKPQQKILLRNAGEKIRTALASSAPQSRETEIELDGKKIILHDGTLVIAAVTSCTNTSNPAAVLGAGLLARNAVRKGLEVPPWVKTSLAPGSKVVADYLEKSSLLEDLEQLGFHIAAYGCTTCIGNSGPLHPAIEEAQKACDLTLAAVLSGNRNFNGRIHRSVKASFLMSPMLVVAYAIAGRVDTDIMHDQLGFHKSGTAVYLSDILPEKEEIQNLISQSVKQEFFKKQYADIFIGDHRWKSLNMPAGDTFQWDETSTYIAEPPYFNNFQLQPPDIKPIRYARPLLILGDSITTDHISPAGAIDPSYPAGRYLLERGVQEDAFNSYGSRRGHHEVMIRGTFANTRLTQQMTAPKEGGFTKKLPEGEIMHVYDAARKYQEEQTDTIILAGKEYGSGSSRDWAAKGTMLLGVRAVIAESFERIHRSNLLAVGVLPLVFCSGDSWKSLELQEDHLFSIELPETFVPKQLLSLEITDTDGTVRSVPVRCRLDSIMEITYFKNGGLLPYILRGIIEDEAGNPR